jgi:hypothetical protein
MNRKGRSVKEAYAKQFQRNRRAVMKKENTITGGMQSIDKIQTEKYDYICGLAKEGEKGESQREQ